jgi:uncharacterized membrane protein YoaK (UPF0700 family)
MTHSLSRSPSRHQQVAHHHWSHAELIRTRNYAAMALAATSGATDAIGFLSLGHVFTSAMTGNLVLLGISLGHRNGERAGRVLASLACFMVGAALGARIARSRKADDPVWPPAITNALAIEAVIFVVYAACWWSVGARPDIVGKAVLLGLGAVALGIQSSAMQRFGVGLNTTFLSGSLTTLVGQLATGHRFRETRHHLLLLLGLVCGGTVAALLVIHSPGFAPLVQLVPLAAALGTAVWLNRVERHATNEGVLDAVPAA